MLSSPLNVELARHQQTHVDMTCRRGEALVWITTLVVQNGRAFRLTLSSMTTFVAYTASHSKEQGERMMIQQNPTRVLEDSAIQELAR